MKHLKSFESKLKTEKFKVGDYVIAKNIDSYVTILEKYLKKNVGKIIDIEYPVDSKTEIVVIYTNLPKDILYYSEVYSKDNIKLYVFKFYENKLRLATLEEIEEYKIKENTINYNL